MIIKDILLNKGEYFTGVYPKVQIYLHHTAGGHRPDWVVHGWNSDKDKRGGQLEVATAYVIGGKSTTDGNEDWDGVPVRCFPEEMWAHHLGLRSSNNEMLNQRSIGIEICNYGPLRLGGDGRYYNYVNKPVPADQVVKLNKHYKGYTYYHRYTDKQVASLVELLTNLCYRHSISPVYRPEMFEVSQAALRGEPGIWSHTSVRSDKFDICPQPHLIKALKQL